MFVKTWGEVLENSIFIFVICITLYYVPYFIRLGWNHAENRTKKVCDMCFRDIKKFNDYNKDKK